MARKSFETLLHCCSLESVPNSNNNEFICGMYELNEEESHRNGAIAVCDENAIISSINVSHGILDMKFAENILACALSSGDILIYEYEYDKSSLKQLHLCESGRSEGLALSLCWNNTTEKSKIAVSSQNGSLLFYSLTSSGLQLQNTISDAHVLQDERVPAWIVAYSSHNENILISGGDDCRMKLWDTRLNNTSPIYSSKHYTAGVTSAHWHPSLENIFAVGSYDNTVKIWDYRHYRDPLCEIDTGGGVWRIKWAPSPSGPSPSAPNNIENDDNDQRINYLAIASMQGGSGIYKWNPSNQSIAILHSHVDSNPNPLIYGIDWLNIEKKTNSLQWNVATCSFYENLVQIWSS